MGLCTSVCHTSFSNVPRPPRQSAGPEQSMAEPHTRDYHAGKGECDRCVCVCLCGWCGGWVWVWGVHVECLTCVYSCVYMTT